MRKGIEFCKTCFKDVSNESAFHNIETGKWQCVPCWRKENFK